MKNISLKEFQEYGISITGDVMDNGESRFRLSSDSSSYIRVNSSFQNGWQKSHYHTEQSELFFVERGEALLASYVGGAVCFDKYKKGDVFVVKPNIPHNIVFSDHAISHTIKWGGKPDWVPFEKLDDLIKSTPIDSFAVDSE